MRPLLFLLAGLALGLPLAAGFVTPAGAVEYPWCANFADGAGANCGFMTYDECMLTARGTGGYCAENTFYDTARSRRAFPPNGAQAAPPEETMTGGPASQTRTTVTEHGASATTLADTLPR